MPRAPWASTKRALPRSSRNALRAGRALAFAVVVALVALVASEARADFTGRVVGVADGDTLTVRDGTRTVRIRLWGIDAPELGQPWSRRSRDALAAVAMRGPAHVVTRGTDSYGRTLARVSVDGVDLAQAQLRGGWAWVFRRYTDDPALIALETDARTVRRGLWADRDPEPPWRFRERAKPAGDALPKRP